MSTQPRLIGRQKEKSILNDAATSQKSEFIAVYGRRRIGKSYLIQQYFKDHPFYFEFVGTHRANLKKQLENFTQELLRTFKNSKLEKQPDSWSEAFYVLRDVIEKLPVDSSKKKVIFFDELPWIASRKSGFLDALGYFWNSFLQKRQDIILVVCGSAASWMIAKIMDSKGGLHNRITKPIPMFPFTLRETRTYLKFKRQANLNRGQISEIYMATGGVADYLDEVQPGESAIQFINRAFFSFNGKLRTEFDRLFASLFDDYQIHVEVVRALAKHRNGLSYQKLAAQLAIEPGGTFSNVLLELEKSAFIHFNPQLNCKNVGVYRLIDEYTYFYLTWVEALGRTFQDEFYWEKLAGKPKHNSWLGYAFENLCFRHSEQIKRDLGIGALTTEVFGFHSDKVQIDMIIRRSDRVLNLCEMKYTSSSYALSKLEAQKISKRRQELLGQLKKREQVFVTLVTPYPAKRNSHYSGLIIKEVNLKGLFQS